MNNIITFQKKDPNIKTGITIWNDQGEIILHARECLEACMIHDTLLKVNYISDLSGKTQQRFYPISAIGCFSFNEKEERVLGNDD